MRPTVSSGLTLATGALLALDRPQGPDVVVEGWLRATRERGGSLCIPATAIAQAWGSARQARLARLLKSKDVEFAEMTVDVARLVGRLCASSGHADVVDVHVALCAQQRNHAVLTSDPDDIGRIDPRLPLIRV